MRLRASFGRVRRLKPAQIADLLEDASSQEGEEILDVVHTDPELEADVFEELDPDIANRLFEDKTDEEVADVIAHMRADDAADAIAELPQSRRVKVLDLLPAGVRTKVVTLLGLQRHQRRRHHGRGVPGGPRRSHGRGGPAPRCAWPKTSSPRPSLTVHAVDDANRLCGTVTRDRPAARRSPRRRSATSWTPTRCGSRPTPTWST